MDCIAPPAGFPRLRMQAIKYLDARIRIRQLGRCLAPLSFIVLASTIESGCNAAERVDNLSEWDTRWQLIQIAPEKVSLSDHWRVCGLKFRFRNYRELFACLDLIEQRVAKLDEKAPQRRYAPVLDGWMRASAYAELREDEEAVKSAESAWTALPDDYREVTERAFPFATAQAVERRREDRRGV